MSNAPAKSRWRKLAKSSFCISVVALILFNAYAAIGKRAMHQSVKRTQLEIDTRHKQGKELASLQKRYYESVSDFTEIELTVQQIHQGVQDEENLFPILNNEFVVTTIDGGFKSGKRTLNLIVPKNGDHRLRIQITHKNNDLLDQQYDLVSGQGYQIDFVLKDKKLQLLFPGQEPKAIELNFDFADRISGLRTALSGRPTFVGCNQPRWRLSSYPDAVEYGELTQFAFLSNIVDPEENIRVKISAQSEGPPTVAADDRATILHLVGLLESNFETPEYRYEDGRYIFEDTGFK